MKFLLALLALCAVSVYAGENCGRRYKDAMKCMIEAADEEANNLDLEEIGDCAKTALRGCFRESPVAGMMGFLSTNMDAIKECAEDLLPAVGESMESCMQRSYPHFHLPSRARVRAHPGLKMMIMDRFLSKISKKCDGVRDCAPDTRDEVKGRLCEAKARCFGTLKEDCADERSEYRETMCDCFKEVKSETTVGTDFKTCLEDNIDGDMPEVPNKVKKVIGMKVKQVFCSDKYDDMGLCDD